MLPLLQKFKLYVTIFNLIERKLCQVSFIYFYIILNLQMAEEIIGTDDAAVYKKDALSTVSFRISKLLRITAHCTYVVVQNKTSIQ